MEKDIIYTISLNINGFNVEKRYLLGKDVIPNDKYITPKFIGQVLDSFFIETNIKLIATNLLTDFCCDVVRGK